MEEHPIKRPEKIKLAEINPYLTCYLCKGYLIDATTISECLHSFCRSCIIKFLQDNSYCPICEVIINKAKPNLKLDKTLQDIVYKLVPELFLKEMTRRKQYYQQYPQIAARVSPEERGEDTERTIFNPQDFISLSMEYVSADSSPGAIKLPVLKNGSDKNDELLAEDNQTLMKRYLQCPGMCRVDVLKKFVRNKYNVDTSLFHIDILYKRVPLPDHYTLIDIAYIYSWKRNEPMKFFFRITDLNKVSERFDYFDSQSTNEVLVQVPVRTPRNNGAASRRKEHVMNKRNSKANKQQELQMQNNNCDKVKCEKAEKTVKNQIDNDKNKCETVEKNEERQVDNEQSETKVVNCDNIGEMTTDEHKLNGNKENVKVKVVEDGGKSEISEETTEISPKRFILKIKKDPEKDNALKTENGSPSFKVSVTSSIDPKDNKNNVVKPEISSQLKSNVQNQQTDIKNPVYTNITLNRTNNVEIITKIQKVADKDGQSVGFNIIKQTVKGSDLKQKKSDKAVVTTRPKLAVIQRNVCEIENKNVLTLNDKKDKEPVDKKPNVQTINASSSESANLDSQEKLKFLETFQLTSKNSIQQKIAEKREKPQKEEIQKRKPTSPLKQQSPKKSKVEKKPVTRIILQTKPKPPLAKAATNKSQATGLQSLIENCKIPSSLSITIKDGTENNKHVPMIPPVKNYIEILKLPDENSVNCEADKDNKINFNFRMNDDSEQKVDEDLAEIAKSLTEKIPMSTTISQIVGPKPEFPIPVKTNVPPKFTIQPSPVPEISNKLLNVPKDNKLNPRSPQSFQKIFEESIKKPDSTCSSPERAAQNLADSNNEVSSTSSNKRNIMEIASQLYKKTKLEQDKSLSHNQIDSTTPKVIPKVAIPRLPNHKNSKSKNSPKFEVTDPLKSQQTITNLHSNALGLNYTISVGPNVSAKTNGIIPKKDVEIKTTDIPIPIPIEAKINSYLSPKEISVSSPKPSPIHRNISPGLGYNSPRNSPKHSPKSSPMIKHMYAPVPNLVVDPLRVNTYSPKLPSPKVNTLNKTASPHLPSSSTCSLSPNTSTASPKAALSLPKSSSLSPKPTSLPPPATSALSVSTSQVTVPSNSSPKPSSSSQSSQSSPLSPNQILERYNIQNLAQLTASLNFNAANYGLSPGNQLAAFQHAMFLKHFEIQNRQNWLNMNQSSLLQYEKYLQNLQNLKTSQNPLLSNIKEN